MEMDPMTIAVLVILVIVVGIFLGSMIGGGSAEGSLRNVNSYPSQYGGGGCGR